MDRKIWTVKLEGDTKKSAHFRVSAQHTSAQNAASAHRPLPFPNAAILQNALYSAKNIHEKKIKRELFAAELCALAAVGWRGGRAILAAYATNLHAVHCV